MTTEKQQLGTLLDHTYIDNVDLVSEFELLLRNCADKEAQSDIKLREESSAYKIKISEYKKEMEGMQGKIDNLQDSLT